MFELRCCRQYDVGIFRGVGLKLFVNDREQILACQTGKNARLIGTNSSRIGVVDVKRLHRGTRQFAVQCLGELHHVDGPRATAG